MQDNLIDQGLNLMLFGMGTVFVFLTILVFATMLMSKLVSRLAPVEHANMTSRNSPAPTAAAIVATGATGATGATVATDSQPSPQIIAAIQQAIAAHRQR